MQDTSFNVLSFGLDAAALDPQSRTALRIARFGNYVDRYTLIVPSKSGVVVKLSEAVTVYGSGGGNKIAQLVKTYSLAKKMKGFCDLVTVQDLYYVGFLAAIIARTFSVGLEIQVHGFEKYAGIRKWLAGRNLRQARGIRVVSERLKREIIAEFGIDPQKITVVPVYTDTSVRECPHRPAEASAPDDAFTFLTVSRLVSVKNISLQIEAFRELRKKYANARLVIVGDGPELTKLQRRAGEGVTFAGRQAEVATYYCQADAFLLTSNREGWGMVVVEAASYGLPIIMTDVGCAGEFIRNNENGIIVPVGGKIELLAAMERLISSTEDRNRLGRSARETAHRLPSFEETMRQYVEGWKKCL